MPHYRFILVCLLLWASCTPQAEGEVVTEIPEEKENAIKGVWLTNIASDALFSRAGIEEAVVVCDRLGFTDIYVVTWNDATTTYPSRVVEAVTGVAIQPELAGRDPLAELIEIAHARGLRVHAWFEFGFACSYNQPDGGALLAARPHWAARDKAGRLATKNNFQWMNAFHPEVQAFITDLILEVVDNYDVDGIQGDDRLPALPSLAGYSDYTRALYKTEHGDREPPDNYRDYDWIKWRSGKLNDYLQRLVDTLHRTDPDLIISMAPSIYPWSEAEYLQDWPSWINMGWIDYVVPQVYRYDIDAYSRELRKIVREQVDPAKHDQVYPGILLQVGDYNPSPGLLDSMIAANRAAGLSSEVYFFYEGVKDSALGVVIAGEGGGND